MNSHISVMVLNVLHCGCESYFHTCQVVFPHCVSLLKCCVKSVCVFVSQVLLEFGCFIIFLFLFVGIKA